MGMTAEARGSIGVVKAWTDAKVNGSIIPTRDYQTGFLTRRTMKAGTTVIIVDIHKGLFGDIVRLSVRNPKTGEYFREVPVDVFAR
jgi:hypothetical protein